jgi:hypothetical protein
MEVLKMIIYEIKNILGNIISPNSKKDIDYSFAKKEIFFNSYYIKKYSIKDIEETINEYVYGKKFLL